MVVYGQVVLGAAGAGKTTYCKGMQHLLQLQKRKCLVVNLDPANDTFDYECALDVRELVDAQTVMDEFKLGPNGALVFCMEYLEKNLDWLQDKLKELISEDRGGSGTEGEQERKEEASKTTTTEVKADFILFDCPGQVELFAMHGSFRRMVDLLTKSLDLRLVCVHCVDVQLCSDENNYMAAVLLCLNIMLNLELPHVNVWTKGDMLKQLGEETGRFAFHSNGNLERLLASCQNNSAKAALTRKLIEIIEDYSLVSFEAIAVEDPVSMGHLLSILDRCVGTGYSSPSPGEQIDDWHEHFLHLGMKQQNQEQSNTNGRTD